MLGRGKNLSFNPLVFFSSGNFIYLVLFFFLNCGFDSCIF
uniref:Uncharacterized protein n=1 Tax=Anguilla anguilla TaxID=7936 RepID=A0A0E9T770_ANGAN